MASKTKTKAKTKSKRQRRPGTPHKRLRRTCKWCAKPKHNRTPIGNAHRFHGPGSFCKTHSTTKRGKLFCKISKRRGN